MTSRDRSAKRERREERREQLLESAVLAIREHGSGVSMEQLAAAGGVTKPILYRHFGDREGLVGAIGLRFADQLTQEIAAGLGSESEPREVLDSTVDRFVSFIDRDPDLYKFLVQYASSRTEGAEVVSGLIEGIGRQVAVVIGEELRARGLDSGAAEPWAFGIVGMVHQAANWWLEHQTMPRERLVKYLTDLLWDGLGVTERVDA